MSKEKNKDKSMTNRKTVRVPFFEDEYSAFGITPTSTLAEACSLIRLATGKVIAARARSGNGVSSLAKAYKNATDEQKAEIARILSSQ